MGIDDYISFIENLLYLPIFFVVGFFLGVFGLFFLVNIPIGIYVDCILTKKGKLAFIDNRTGKKLDPTNFNVNQIFKLWLRHPSLYIIITSSLIGLGLGLLARLFL